MRRKLYFCFWFFLSSKEYLFWEGRRKRDVFQSRSEEEAICRGLMMVLIGDVFNKAFNETLQSR